MLTDYAIFGNSIRICLLKAASFKCVWRQKGLIPVEVCTFAGQTETSARRRPESCARRSAAILGRTGANPRYGARSFECANSRAYATRRTCGHRGGSKAIGCEHILPVPEPQAIPVLQTRRPQITLFGTLNRTAHQTISLDRKEHV